MKRYIVLLMLLVAGKNSYSQSSFEAVLIEIEANNTTLQTFMQLKEAQKIGNKTGIYLSNPEVGLNYMFGNAEAGGNQADFTVSQSFDFPTAYYYKSSIANGLNSQAELEYRRQRKILLLQASKICTDLVYLNALKVELDKRLQHAQHIADAFQQRFDRGDADVLERNKARLNLLSAKKAAESNEVERKALQTELIRMNGGKPITLEAVTHQPYLIAPNFEQWYELAEQNNPELQSIAQNVEISKKQEKLNRAMSLPKLSAGYISERIAGSVLQGPSVSITIPMWENKNTVKHAKAQTIALQNAESDAQLQFYNILKMQYNKAVSLQSIAKDFREILQTMDNGELLKKALDQGQLSLINYVVELSIYYETVNNALIAERDLQYVVSELQQWEK